MSLAYKVLFRESFKDSWEEVASYNTKEYAVNYIENVIPTMRPVQLVFGQDILRQYGFDHSIVDYEYISKLEEENKELKNGIWEVRKK